MPVFCAHFRPYKADVPNASHKLPALVIEAQYQQLLSYPQQHLERFGWRQWGSTASCRQKDRRK